MRSIHITTERYDGNVTIYNVDDFPYMQSRLGVDTCRGSGKRAKTYYNLPTAFDIETTTIKEPDGGYSGYMYIWQYCIGHYVCMGRTWEELRRFCYNLQSTFELGEGVNLVTYIHNASFEFQFMRNFFEISDVFARSERDVVKFTISEGIEFRCSYALSNMSLEKMLKNARNVRFMKQSGEDYNYDIIRTPETVMTDEELSYCYCDVAGLCEALNDYLIDDNMVTIPMTSTGFVRRDTRNAMLSNPRNWYQFRDTRLDAWTYAQIKTAVRGGNTHTNAIYTGMILGSDDDPVKSKDKASSYPSVMMLHKFPGTKFVQRSASKFRQILNEGTQAMLIDVEFENIRIKSYKVIPYIARSNCGLYGKDSRYDNGRIVSSSRVQMVITDVDFRIIESQYEWDGMWIRMLKTSRYQMLPKEFRQLICDYFTQKTKLKILIGKKRRSGLPTDDDEYMYNKFKNKINALFGMMLTDICNDDVIYDPDDTERAAYTGWRTEECNIDKKLAQYYNNRKNCLRYQWGCWVTAWARYELQLGLDAVSFGIDREDGTRIPGGYDTIYVDTDSIKYYGDHDEAFEILNRRIIAQCEAADVPAYAEIDGKRYYLGVWEDDAVYSQFIAWGAKKYAYILQDEPGIVHTTVAGLSKKGGSRFFTQHGMEAFKPGIEVPADVSGRTAGTYCDRKDREFITIDGCRILRGSSIGIHKVAYSLGITEEYRDYKDQVQEMISLDNEVF